MRAPVYDPVIGPGRAPMESPMNRSSARWVGAFLLVTAPLFAGCQHCCPRECVEVSAVAAPSAIVQNAPPRTDAEVFVDIEIYRVAADKFTTQMASLYFPDGHGERHLSKIDAAELRMKLPKGPGVEVVALPKVLVTVGQEATLTVGETVGPDQLGRTGEEPLSFSGGDNWTGHRAAFVVSTSANGANVTMDFSFASREPVAKGKAADLAASKASALAFHVAQLTVASGETAMLWKGPSSDSAKPQLLVLVTPRVLRPEEVAQAAQPSLAPPAAAPVKPPTPAVAGNVDALKAIKLTLAVQDRPLLEVLKTISMTTNINMAISPAVKDSPVTIDVKDQDVATLLAALGKDRFRWVVEDYGLVRITGLAE